MCSTCVYMHALRYANYKVDYDHVILWRVNSSSQVLVLYCILAAGCRDDIHCIAYFSCPSTMLSTLFHFLILYTTSVYLLKQVLQVGLLASSNGTLARIASDCCPWFIHGMPLLVTAKRVNIDGENGMKCCFWSTRSLHSKILSSTTTRRNDSNGNSIYANATERKPRDGFFDFVWSSQRSSSTPPLYRWEHEYQR